MVNVVSKEGRKTFSLTDPLELPSDVSEHHFLFCTSIRCPEATVHPTPITDHTLDRVLVVNTLDLEDVEVEVP